MKLADLRPTWIALAGRDGQGIVFDCPCCVGTPRALRLAVAFANPLDGREPIGLNPAVLRPVLWPTGTEGAAVVPPGTHWQRTGADFDSMTLHPSVDASPAGHWHGWVNCGLVR
jgi:hypothetical protein